MKEVLMAFNKLSSTIFTFEPLFSVVSASIFDNIVLAFRAVHSSSIERHFFILLLLCISTCPKLDLFVPIH